MLLWFHVVLVASGILFSFGFSLYELAQYSRAGAPGALILCVFFAAGGVGLAVYLGRVLRYGLRGGPR